MTKRKISKMRKTQAHLRRTAVGDRANHRRWSRAWYAKQTPEWKVAYCAKQVAGRRRRVYGIVGTPEERPEDRCSFPGCVVIRATAKRGEFHADHDHSITDGRPNFRGWLCRTHNVAVGFFEKFASACQEYLKGATYAK